MKLQIDTTEKTIKIKEQVNLGELLENLESLLPNGQWKEYKLEASIITEMPKSLDLHHPFWNLSTIHTSHNM